MLWRSGRPSITVSLSLLEIWKPPLTFDSRGSEMFARLELLSKTTSPVFVKLGAVKLLKELLKKPSWPVNDDKDGTETWLTLRKVMFCPASKLGNSICSFKELPAKLRRPVQLVMLLTFTCINAVFAVISKLPTVPREIPSSEVNPVLVIDTLLALEMPWSKDKDWRLGNAAQSIVPTEVRVGKLKVVRVIRPWRSKVLPMLLREGAESDVRLPAPSAFKLPVICCIPFRVIEFSVFELIERSPLMVEQLRPSASP